jgi:hypothetical protein
LVFTFRLQAELVRAMSKKISSVLEPTVALNSLTAICAYVGVVDPVPSGEAVGVGNGAHSRDQFGWSESGRFQ